MKSELNIRALAPFALLLTLGLANCASNPTGGTNFVLMSENPRVLTQLVRRGSASPCGKA